MPDPRVARRDLLKWAGAAGLTGTALAGGARAHAQEAGSPTASYVAPAADSEGELTISNWGDPNDQQVYTAARERFSAKYPDVQVNDNFTPITTWTDYINSIITQVAGGTPPDVINIAIEGFRFGMDNDLFRPLDDFLAADPAGQDLIGDVDPRLIDPFRVNGQTHLIPFAWNAMLIYYNTKMFADAGIARPSDDWTWDDFLQTAQTLTSGDVFGFVLPFFNFGLSPWWFSNGTAQLTPDLTTPMLTDPAMIEAVTFVHDLVRVHKVAPAVEGTEPYQLFPAGRAAMTGAGHWVVGSFRDLGFEDYDVVPWPQRTTKATVFGNSGFGIYPGTQQPELAWEYIKELASAESAELFVSIGAANPARQSAANSPAFLEPLPEHSELYYQAIDYAQAVQAPAQFTDLETIFMRHMGEVMSGSASPEEAMQSAQGELETALQG